MRLRAQQACSAFSKTPQGAVAAAFSRSESANTIFADLPPSSRVTRVICVAQPSIMRLPTSVDPVNTILRTRLAGDKPLAHHRTFTGQHLEQPLGQSCLETELRESDACQGGPLGGLQYARVARSECGCKAPRRNRHRKVPRCNNAHDAEWLSKCDIQATRNRDLPPTQSFRACRVVLEHVSNMARFPPSLAERMSRILHFQPREFFDRVIHRVCETAEQPPPIGRGNRHPFALCAGGAGNCSIRGLDRCGLDRGHDGFSGGIDDGVVHAEVPVGWRGVQRCSREARYARAALMSSRKIRRSDWSSSGCHCTPMAKFTPVHSTASITPSAATAVTRRSCARVSTAWW